jgi:hypothetical protein
LFALSRPSGPAIATPERGARLLAASVILIRFSALSRTQLPPPGVTIQVDADQADGPLPPDLGYFGFDETNYSYVSNGASKAPEDQVRFRQRAPVAAHACCFTTVSG